MAAETGQLKKKEFGPAKAEEDRAPGAPSEKPAEEKPKPKVPQAARPLGGQSALIQKRLGKGQKFFDSGDYQMYKQRGVTAEGAKKLPPTLPVLSQPTGEEIPRPDTVPTRKTSIITQPPKFAPPTST